MILRLDSRLHGNDREGYWNKITVYAYVGKVKFRRNIALRGDLTDFYL